MLHKPADGQGRTFCPVKVHSIQMEKVYIVHPWIFLVISKQKFPETMTTVFVCLESIINQASTANGRLHSDHTV